MTELPATTTKGIAPVFSRENEAINVVRVIAALLVVAGHGRILFFADYDDVPHDLLQTFLYGITSIGKQAVIVFFVLSGFWVGGGAVRKLKRRGFSLADYVIDRCVRLWLVLIPALVLTLLLDSLGRSWFGSMSSYTGDPSYGGVVSDTPGSLGVRSFLENALFLGGVNAPTYGTNGALWSIGYEFWMYILGPAIVFVFFRRTVFTLVIAVAAIGLAFVINPHLLTYLPIWVLGALVAAHQDWIAELARRIHPRLLTTLQVLAVGATLGVSFAVRGLNSLPSWAADYLVAIVAAFLLATLTNNRKPIALLSKLASSSYSLYAIHVPILIFAVALLGINASNRWASDLVHWGIFILLLLATTAIGWLFAQATERHTNRVRIEVKRLSQRIAHPKGSTSGRA
jgi:peptidoglycan/LPS O-acetylase OafA/YrhL